MKDQLEIIDPRTYPAWDRLVAACRTPTIFHTSGWARVLHESYGYQPTYLVRILNNTLDVLVPLAEVRSFLTGARAVSLPFTDYCDPIYPDEATGREMVAYLTDYGKRRKWRSWELRGGDSLFRGTAHASSYDGHVLALTKDARSLYANVRDSTKRNIRKAEREGVTILRTTARSSIHTFYEIHCRTRKKHGLPPQPLLFFQKIHEHLISRGLGRLFLAQHGGRTIAGAMFLEFGREVIYKFGASEPASLPMRPNDLIMWTAIEQYACEGYERFSFGRTDHENAGLQRFKAGWGAREQQFRYYKYDLRKNMYVQNKLKVTGGHNMFFRNMPLPVLKIAGTVLYRHIG